MPKLLQELALEETGDPFWVPVACMLLNRTNRKQAEPIFWGLVSKGKEFLVSACPSEIEGLISPLGFGKNRSKLLSAYAVEYVSVGPPTRADDLRDRFKGCGKYARDSWAILVSGESAEPTDGPLTKRYEEFNRISWHWDATEKCWWAGTRNWDAD